MAGKAAALLLAGDGRLSVLGVSDGAARVPSAMDATLLVIAVYLFFRRFRRGVEIDAALITGHLARESSAMPAPLPWTCRSPRHLRVGMLAWWAWRESGRRAYLALFYVFMALGTLAKGPVAPFLAAVDHRAVCCRTRELRLIVKPFWLPGILLFLAVALPWYIAVATTQSAILPRIYPRAQSRALLEQSLSSPRAFLVLPSRQRQLSCLGSAFVIAAYARAGAGLWEEHKADSPEPTLRCNWICSPAAG